MNLVKAFLGLSLFLFVQMDAQAHPPHSRHRGKATVVIGKNAKAIFEALNVESKIKDRPRFVVEKKKVGTLVCVKANRKITEGDQPKETKERFACLLRKRFSPRSLAIRELHENHDGRENFAEITDLDLTEELNEEINDDLDEE